MRDAISVTDCITEDLTTTDYEEELSCCNGGTTGSITQTLFVSCFLGSQILISSPTPQGGVASNQILGGSDG